MRTSWPRRAHAANARRNRATMVQNIASISTRDGQRAGIAPEQRVKPHRAEDEDQRRRECDLGRDQLGDEDQPEILDTCAAELLEERNPMVIGIPEDDRRKQRKRDEAAEIGPWRQQPAPQLRHADQPDQDRRAEEQRGVFRQQRRADGRADRKPPYAASGLQHFGERRTARSSRPPTAASPASRSACRPPPSA